MKKITLNRSIRGDNKRAVIGEIVSEAGNQLCVTLELPENDNKRDISCIPVGTYECFYRTSSTNNTRIGGKIYQLKNVPDRGAIQIHIGNFMSNTQGCILVGRATNLHVITQSTEAMRDLLEHLGTDDFILEVRNV